MRTINNPRGFKEIKNRNELLTYGYYPVSAGTFLLLLQNLSRIVLIIFKMDFAFYFEDWCMLDLQM